MFMFMLVYVFMFVRLCCCFSHLIVEPEHIVVDTKLVKLDQTLHIPQHRKHSTSEDKKISLEISE